MAVDGGVYPIKPEDTDILLANGIVLTKFTAFFANQNRTAAVL